MAGRLASPALTAACLALLALVVFSGTIYQAVHGLDETRAFLFDAWYFLAFGFLPVPAVRSLFLLLALNLAAALVVGFRRGPGWAGPWLVRLGSVILITAVFVFPGTGDASYLTLAEGDSAHVALSGDQRQVPLPFSVRLLEFQKELYPGSRIAKRYSSRIEVKEATATREAVIEMNRPFRAGGYALYQFSYADLDGGRTASTLAVTRTAGRLWPYAASLVVLAGLLALWLARVRMNRTETGAARPLPSPPPAPPATRAVSAVFLLLALALAGGAAWRALARGPADDFGRIPILCDGRVMPLDSFPPQRLGNGLTLRVIPTPKGSRWLTPREAAAAPADDPEAAKAAGLFGALARAAAAGKTAEFHALAREFRSFSEGRLGAGKTADRLRWEVALNRLDPFRMAEVFYALAALAALLRVVAARRAPWSMVLAAPILGLLLHVTGLGLRMLITGRPPVTNLYSTFVFASCAAVLLALVAERRARSGVYLLIGSQAGVALLWISDRVAAGGDTLGQLAAVLDTNLWLGAHVVTIMLGFVGCLMAGLTGHMYLVWAWRRPRAAARLQPIYRTMAALLTIGLAFSFFGTVLGGMWADCAWGRFWGWDPKENGALLVILWGVALLLARSSHLVEDIGMATGCAAINIVIALAWMGVNLLGVGLHSYGWTSGVSMAFFTFVGLEMTFIGALYLLCTGKTPDGAEAVPP